MYVCGMSSVCWSGWISLETKTLLCDFFGLATLTCSEYICALFSGDSHLHFSP